MLSLTTSKPWLTLGFRQVKDRVIGEGLRSLLLFLGDKEMFKKYGDIILAIIAFIILVVFFTWMNRAEAGEFFPGTGRLGIGVAAEHDSGNPPFCYSSDVTGDIFGEYDLYTFEPGHRVSFYYLHNSCFEEQNDRGTSDRLGIRFVWEFK